MTYDEEIIKEATEAYEKNLSAGCYVGDLLRIIKSQRAEIERFHNLQKPTETGGFKIENGKVIYYSDMLNGYRHEFKDLDEVVKELNLYMHTNYKNIELISHYQHKAQTTKTEAYREFAERLKAQYVDYDNNVGAVGKSTLYKAIDRIKKELTESK